MTTQEDTDAALAGVAGALGTERYESETLVADLRIVNGQLVARVAAQAAEIVRLQAIIDGDPPPDPDPDPDPDPTGLPLMGRSSSSNDHGPLKQCDVVRVYKFGSVVDQELAESKAKALFLSDEPGVQTASQLDSALASLFNRHPDTLVYYMPDNEITADQLSSSQATAHTEKLRTMKAVVDKYPNAYLGINITAYGVRQGRHEILEPCKQYLDILIASCYNPGRMKSPPVWDPYADYLDPILDVVADWGVPRFGCGEFGTPISPSDSNRRPSYAAGAVVYMHDGCVERGITDVGYTYWDNQKSGGPANQLSHDNPQTAQAWKDALT